MNPDGTGGFGGGSDDHGNGNGHGGGPDESARNVLGEPLKPCSTAPMTGFFRDGCCNTGPQDLGRHVLCSQVTQEFLAFSKSQGNDLSTPRPEFGFAGLKPGDRWCLCADRWQEALEAGKAPRVVLQSTHELCLEHVAMEDLKKFALDLS